MITATVIFLLLGQESLFRTIVKNPTGRNGYEDYLVAADLSSKADLQRFIRWTPTQLPELEEHRKELLAARDAAESEMQRQELEEDLVDVARRIEIAGQLDGKSPLEIDRMIVAGWLPSLQRLQLGNMKVVVDPRSMVDLETTYPEYPAFRTLGLSAPRAAYATLADGDGVRASEMIVEAMRFMDRQGRFSLIGRLVGISMQTASITQLHSFLDRLPARGLDSLIAFCNEELARVPGTAHAVVGEGRFVKSMADEIRKDPHAFVESFGSFAEVDAGEREQKFLEELKRLDSASRDRLARRYEAHYVNQLKLSVAIFSEPESNWLVEDEEVPAGDDLLDWLYSTTGPAPTYWIRRSEAIFRTKLRILRLQARVFRHHWETGVLPTQLEEVAPEGELLDPLNGKVFRLERIEGLPRVFSDGSPETGKIDLTTRTSGTAQVENREPPPADSR